MRPRRKEKSEKKKGDWKKGLKKNQPVFIKCALTRAPILKHLEPRQRPNVPKDLCPQKASGPDPNHNMGFSFLRGHKRDSQITTIRYCTEGSYSTPGLTCPSYYPHK